ncbi:hypothetical protein HII36_45690 [Nonomuraea sp. NN258]|uniref:hypothetical protein n=1 Tax=Nonomuraea antri TaxID=2730852 RepID=UPI00156982C5|nr:hypothetical protein [Nonomuraea antri]NRQ39068.1 hypothetical protein [Nonomuraea antri]
MILDYDTVADRWDTYATNGPIHDLTAADGRIVATSLESDRLIDWTILDPGRGSAESLGGFPRDSPITGLGMAFDGESRLWYLIEEQDGSILDYFHLEVYDDPEGEDRQPFTAVDGMSAPIDLDLPDQTSGYSLFWTRAGPLAMTSSGINRYVLATETVEVDRDNSDHRCGESTSVWTGTSLIVWGGNSCGGDVNAPLGWQITPPD